MTDIYYLKYKYAFLRTILFISVLNGFLFTYLKNKFNPISGNAIILQPKLVDFLLAYWVNELRPCEGGIVAKLQLLHAW